MTLQPTLLFHYDLLHPVRRCIQFFFSKLVNRYSIDAFSVFDEFVGVRNIFLLKRVGM
jgi:hypothetical protein